MAGERQLEGRVHARLGMKINYVLPITTTYGICKRPVHIFTGTKKVVAYTHYPAADLCRCAHRYWRWIGSCAFYLYAILKITSRAARPI
jgi:hypothetical protein